MARCPPSGDRLRENSQEFAHQVFILLIVITIIGEVRQNLSLDRKTKVGSESKFLLFLSGCFQSFWESWRSFGNKDDYFTKIAIAIATQNQKNHTSFTIRSLNRPQSLPILELIRKEPLETQLLGVAP